MIHNQIYDGWGSENSAKVGPEGELYTVVHPHPPKDEVDTSIPYREKLKNSAGQTNMNVDGSVTAQEFYLEADEDLDIYINSLSVRIADTGSMALNKFGAEAELTNGVEWTWETNDFGVVTLHEGITTNIEFIRTGHKTHAIGTGTDAYLADVSGGGTEKAYLPIIDISEQFGKPWGIRLRATASDRMVFRVRDDLTGLSTFDIIAYGIKF